MLFVLFGAVAKMGHVSREYFTQRGFELVKKKYYLPEDIVLNTYFDERDTYPYDEVASCDFVYENSGMVVGFDKRQIINAVRGRCDILLTLSPEMVDLIRAIKKTHGEYVTVIGCYIDQYTIERMSRALPGVSEAEVQLRTSIGRRVHEIMVGERDLFDEVVIYGGENSPFNLASLAGQYAHMIDRAKLVERKLNDRMYVELPYTGKKPYVFVSYAHDDEAEVLPVISALQRESCRIWYDEGIEPGQAWRITVASKIEACACFMLFASARSTASGHVSAEINAALVCDKRIITVRLDDARFRLNLEMYLANYEFLRMDDPSLTQKILSAVSECREEPANAGK